VYVILWFPSIRKLSRKRLQMTDSSDNVPYGYANPNKSGDVFANRKMFTFDFYNAPRIFILSSETTPEV